MSLEEFSTKLKELMKTEQVSRRALATKIDVERKSLLNWLNGLYYPRYNALIKVADFFKVSTDYLLGTKEGLSEKEYKSMCEMGEVPKKFCEKLSGFLEKEHKSKYWLAKKLGIGQTTLSRWFACGSMPEITTLIKISSLMKEPIDYLLSRE